MSSTTATADTDTGGAEASLDIEDVATVHCEALHNAGFDSIEEVAEQSPEALTEAINTALAVMADPVDFTEEVQGVSTKLNNTLKEEGISTLPELARLEIQSFADNHGISPGRLEVAQQSALEQTDVVTITEAGKIIDAANAAEPVGPKLLSNSLSRYEIDDPDNGSSQPSARIQSIERGTDSGSVGSPLFEVADGSDPADEDMQYVSEVGVNEESPVPTGLPVHEETGYQQIPRLETDPAAGEHALPVDDDGNVIKPAIPPSKFGDAPLDELIAKKLAVNAPVRIVGPPGVGKNLFLKYLAWEINVGYRSIDVNETTTPDDLFGPLTPDEDGIVVPRSGPVKEGLLNGDFVVINEFPAMQAGVAMSLHRLLNEGTLLINSHGELIEPHPAARIIITMNPPGDVQNRGSEAMAKPTRERFRSFWWGYPEKSDEVETLFQQANKDWHAVERSTVENIVEFAQRTRQERNDSWPTLSLRSLNVVFEHIKHGMEPQAAVKNVLAGIEEPRGEDATDAHSVLEELIG